MLCSEQTAVPVGAAPNRRGDAAQHQERTTAVPRPALLGRRRTDPVEGCGPSETRHRSPSVSTETVLAINGNRSSSIPRHQAACSSDAGIGKASVEILRSVISHVLQEQPEPRHFHFNEALFKPYENLLCFDLCYDADIQDQVNTTGSVPHEWQ